MLGISRTQSHVMTFPVAELTRGKSHILFIAKDFRGRQFQGKSERILYLLFINHIRSVLASGIFVKSVTVSTYIFSALFRLMAFQASRSTVNGLSGIFFKSLNVIKHCVKH